MNTTTTAGEVTTPKKVAFVDRKSANSNRIDQDEKELKQLLADKEDAPEVETQEAEPTNAEEKVLRNVMVILGGICKRKKSLGKISLAN